MPTDEEMLKATNERTQAFAELLAEYLKERFDYKRPGVRLGISRCSVDARTAKYDLYFRVTPDSMRGWSSDTLVVSRIGFTNHRQGHGRALMQFLVEVAGKLPYTHIGIEYANPDATAFGARFGFVRYGEGKDLLASVSSVQEKLRQAPTTNRESSHRN